MLALTSCALGCNAIFAPIRADLCARFPAEVPPQMREHSAFTGMQMLNVARRCRIPEMVKCAAYQIIGSKNFWEHLLSSGDVEERRKPLATLSDMDLFKLMSARQWLQKEWRTLSMIPPGTEGYAGEDGEGEKVVSQCVLHKAQRDEREWCCYTKDRHRKANWYLFWKDEVEDASNDPIGAVTLLAARRERLSKHWCQPCLEERLRVWQVAKAHWWTQLDELLQLYV